MKKLSLLLILIIGLASCGNKESKKTGTVEQAPTETKAAESPADGHNAKNSLSYAGTYEGTMPCADCPGIDVVITLDYEGNYIKKVTYKDREPDNVFTTSGKFVWDGKGIKITLQEKDGETFKVVEGGLIMLDAHGNEVTGENAALYRLKQTKVSE